jgi:hypothetical protein
VAFAPENAIVSAYGTAWEQRIVSGTGLPFFDTIPPQYATPLFFALFIAMWCAMGVFVAWAGGWAELAMHYRNEGPFEGRKWRFSSARFGSGTSYSGMLTVGANRQGLYLAVLPLFRPGHPPLFIPWEDVRKPARRWYDFFGTPLELGAEPGLRVTFYGGLVGELEAETGREIPAARGA